MNQADDMDSILSEGELSIDSEVALWHELLGGLSSASELSGSHETLQEALASADGGMARGSDALTDVDTDVDENDDVFDDDEASWSDSEQEAEEAARPAPSGTRGATHTHAHTHTCTRCFPCLDKAVDQCLFARTPLTLFSTVSHHYSRGARRILPQCRPPRSAGLEHGGRGGRAPPP